LIVICPPGGVYFMALLKRLRTTSLSLSRSAQMNPMSEATSILRFNSFFEIWLK